MIKKVGELMESIGDKLRKARQAKGYTLDDLQQITKIQKRYLIAIEDNDFDVLPGDFYKRAFVKQIADHIGLDGEYLLSDFEPSTSTKHSIKKEVVSPIEKRRTKKTTSHPILQQFFAFVKTYFPTILLGTIAIAIVFAMGKAWMGNPKKVVVESSISTSVESSSSIESSSSSSSSSVESSSSSSVESSSSSSSSESASVQGAGIAYNGPGDEYGSQSYSIYDTTYPLNIKIENHSGDPLWGKVIADGDKILDQVYEGHTSATAIVNQGTTFVYIEFGYPPTGAVYVNGTQIPIPENTDTKILYLSLQ